MKKFFIAALAALVLVGCQHEQSQLNLADISTSATIQGTLLYDGGYVAEGSALTTANLPAEGVEVVAEVPYSAYDTQATGTKQFVTKTDADGKFSFKIPVGQRAITIAIYAREFTAEYNKLKDAYGKLIPATATYKHSGTSTTVKAGDITTLTDIVVAADPEDIRTRNLQISILGKVLVPFEKAEEDNYNQYDGNKLYVADYQGYKCTLKVTFSNGSEEIIYDNVATNNEGEYTLSANLYDVWDITNTHVRVEVAAALEEHFTHWYFDINRRRWYSEDVVGIYQAGSRSATLGTNALLLPVELNDLKINFTPADPSSIRGIGNPALDEDKDEYGYSYLIYATSNPFGWNWRY